jgi:hypothetical protein
MKYLIINGAGSSIDINENFKDGYGLLKELKENHDFGNIIKNHNPFSIDYLITNIIDQNKHEEFVKKVRNSISSIISEAQNKVSQWNNNYFFDIIQNRVGVDNVEQIDVINFNYDTTLEKVVEYFINLYEKEEGRISKLKELLIRIENSHVYGYIGDNGDKIDFIRIKNRKRTEEFITKIKNAENIYFLGFGFDRINLQNLGFFDYEVKNHFSSSFYNETSKKSKKIFVTNYVDKIKPTYSGGKLSGGKTVVAIDERRFPNNIMLTLEEIFNCKIQIVRDGFFSQGFLYKASPTFSWHPVTLYISELTVGEAIKKDFIFY